VARAAPARFSLPPAGMVEHDLPGDADGSGRGRRVAVGAGATTPAIETVEMDEKRSSAPAVFHPWRYVRERLASGHESNS
jgi:hypothetical protein